MNTEPPDDQGKEQSQTQRGPGRPRKWPKERRIQPIYEGRMSFQPGDKHPMDAQIEQARDLREDIIGELAELQELMVHLAGLDDASEAISREEQAVTALLWDLYSTLKHRDHIVASFIAARRRRLLQRLQAAKAALMQARQFLEADIDILPRLRQAIEEAEASALALHGPPPPMPERPASADETQEEQEDGETPEANDDEADVSPDQREQEVQVAQERKARKALLQTVGGGDDATATRAALADFEERVRTMRSAIADGQGWFEWYYVKRPKRKRYTQEAKAYLERDEEVPEDVEMYVEEEDDRPPWGPYLRYRMYEGGTQITMGMGHIRRRNLQGPSDPPKL